MNIERYDDMYRFTGFLLCVNCDVLPVLLMMFCLLQNKIT